MLNKIPYTKEGYIDIPAIAREGRCTPFIVIIGARQTGKTYGTVEYLADQYPDDCIMWIRRTEKEREALSSSDAERNPFAGHEKPVGAIKSLKDCTAFYRPDANEPFARAYALSTSGNMRGVSYPWANVIVFDEFIPTVTARPIKNEQQAFNDLHDTVSGNRELQGKQPLKVFLLANSNDIGAPILAGLNLTQTVLKMVRKKQEIYISPQRGVTICLISDSPVARRRAQTSLHRLAGGTTYSKMATSNDFSFNHFEGIRSCPIKEYKTICTWGRFTILKHKTFDRWYVISKALPARANFPANESGRKNCLRYLMRYRLPFMLIDDVQVRFCDYESKKAFHDIEGIVEK